MHFFTSILILCSLILPGSVLGMQILDKRGNVEIELPRHWKYERNLFGLPHVFLGPGETKKVSVSLTVTGIEDVKLPSHELMKNQDQYQKGRKEWAKKRGITITSFYPYIKKKIGSVISHNIGVDYMNKNEEQSEKSYFIECPQSLIHLKAVGPKSSVHFKEALSLIETLKCQGKLK